MFLVLGLLATPSELIAVAPAALLVAAGMIFVARPVAVWLSLLFYRAPAAEKLFISWVGLRGAVPVVLALFPLLAGTPNAGLLFNIAFMVVLASLLTQGTTIGLLARSPSDIAGVLAAVAGRDERDFSMPEEDVPDFLDISRQPDMRTLG